MRKEVIWGKRCPSKATDPTYAARGRELFDATIAAYNERVKDAVLTTHARKELDALGIGAWLIGPREDPFEPKPALPIVE
jgi:hypothetical protein